jgi:hypothetical protein
VRRACGRVTGDLTVRDITRPLVLQVDLEGASSWPFGDERIASSAATDVNRDDVGLTWNQTLENGGMLVGKTARIELNVSSDRPGGRCRGLSPASDPPPASVHGAPTAFSPRAGAFRSSPDRVLAHCRGVAPGSSPPPSVAVRCQAYSVHFGPGTLTPTGATT